MQKLIKDQCKNYGEINAETYVKINARFFQ